jgi:hypothetical protein
VTMLTRRLRIIAGSVAVVLAGAAVLAVAMGTDTARSSAPREVASSAESSATEPALALPAPSDSAAVPPEAAEAEAPDQAPQPGPDPLVGPPVPDVAGPPAPQSGPGAEIPPVASEGAADERVLPESETQPPMLTGPTPATATAVNAVVDGFPEAIPIADRSDVLTSDVAVEDHRVRVSLTATSPSSGADVLAEYDSALAATGFHPAEAPAVGGSTARAYSRGSESVTVTVTPAAAGASRYSVLALILVQE